MINLRYLKAIRNWFVAIAFVASAGGALMTIAVPSVAVAADDCNSGFLGFPAWYRGLTSDAPECDIVGPTGEDGSLSKFIWHIVFNVIEIAIIATAYLSGFFFIYGGFLFITSRGRPEGAANARTTMINALIGLIISLAAVVLVNFIFEGLLK